MPRGGLEDVFAAAERHIKGGATVLVLTDRGLDRSRAPIPSMTFLIRPKCTKIPD